ncbi:MAG: CBS domain-containing protein [Methanomassiliicoccales archaeon]|nr:CBS domain-containing protein [Methanomassiliicoccales archaeon]NYT15568.1 CBS domain-containing protein [Methanomassiliicoccales archaeon]
MRVSFKVASAIGIPIRIHVTFLLILPLFAAVFGLYSNEILGIRLGFGGLGLGLPTELMLGTIAAILFFLSVLVHELAHSYVAIKYGYEISSITLFIFGGVSQIEKVPSKAPGEAFMAFVGPASSMVLGAAFIPLSFLIYGLGEGFEIEIPAIMVGLIGFYNLFLGAFNLLPAFPMDGGRIVRALLARRMSFMKATQTAATLGKAIAIGMGFFGILILNFWLVLLAIFIYFGAGEEERGTKLSEAFQGVRVKELMTSEVSSVSPEDTVRELLDRMLTEKHMGYPVLDRDRVVGVVTLQDASRVSKEQQWMIQVKEIMSREIVSVSPETEVMDAVRLVSSKGIGRLIVMEEGEMVGIVTRTDLVKAMEILSMTGDTFRPKNLGE